MEMTKKINPEKEIRILKEEIYNLKKALYDFLDKQNPEIETEGDNEIEDSNDTLIPYEDNNYSAQVWFINRKNWDTFCKAI